jgi:hypothetical protein
VGTFEEMQAELGPEFFARRSSQEVNRHNWQPLCVCGHLARAHATPTGGEYRIPEAIVRVTRGVEWTTVTTFEGCTGALPARGFEQETMTADRPNNLVTRVIHPTCPCVEFVGVVNVDRPNRYFNQRIPADRSDFTRHPFQLGLKAFSTHLSRRRAALSDPTWPAAEFNRRFLWLEDARVCGLSKCREVDGVFPVYIDGDRSELRCPAHR